jgi:hypothetical protein
VYFIHAAIVIDLLLLYAVLSGGTAELYGA